MGKFIISRSAAGDRFSLQSDIGHTLAVSRDYATLDACKKGIASLIVNAPVIPVLDATAGEYGPNPKFEIVAAEGGFAFLMKSANGKSVLHSPAYATKKACLRAIAMLRRGVANYEILFYTREGLTPLTMKPPRGAAAKPAADPAPAVIRGQEPSITLAKAPVRPLLEEEEPLAELADIPDVTEDSAASARVAAAIKAEPQPTPTAPPATTAVTPRLIRLQPTQKAAVPPAATPAKQQTSSTKEAAKRRGIFGIIFKK